VAYNLALPPGIEVFSLLQAGLNVTAIGISVVFILLGLLVGIIRGMSAVCRLIENAMPQAAAPAGSPQTPYSDQQLIGVITAAIAAHRRR
jgi:sodium pump decarboxylase gamma subunit